MLQLNLVLVLCFVGVYCCGDYYWRDYDGRIPLDAIPGGPNTETGTSYIGQAYIHNFGVLMASIIPGKMEVSVPCYGVKRTDVIIKILCAKDPSKYEWIQSTRDFYSKNITNRCPVSGGYDQKQIDYGRKLGTLHIGRVILFGNAIIGNIAIYDPYPTFYYPLNSEEKGTHAFEALLFKENAIEDI